MGIRRCIVKDCLSSSARTEDRGVTYHKIPANEGQKQKWMVACRLPDNYVINKGSNVCSRHFRKADFQEFKGTKYVLRGGVVPSIFPWSTAGGSSSRKKKEEDKKKTNAKQEKEPAVKSPPATEKDTEVDASASGPPEEAKKDDEEQVVEDKKPDDETEPEVADDKEVPKEDVLLTPMSAKKAKSPASKKRSTPKRPASARASSSAAKKARRSDTESNVTTPKEKKVAQSPRKSHPTTPGSMQSQINFSPGSRIEAQDFSGKWHPAKLGEVDTEEGEVLVQFEKNGKSKSSLNDEWIPMDSVRLRPLQPQQKTPSGKLRFAVGEKCFARWSDSRKFKATIQAILENDMYEVLFDDGFVKVCKSGHISKLKKADSGQEPELLDVEIKQEPEDTKPVNESLTTNMTPIAALYIPQIAKVSEYPEIPKTGEWCCHWMNDFPVGEEAVLDVGGSKIHTVIVDDWRLPEGWIKHIYQRITVYGKLDTVLVNEKGRTFRSRQEVKTFLAENGEIYDGNVYDFGLHKKRAKDLGFLRYTKEYKDAILPPVVPAEPVLLNTEVNIGSVKVKIINNLFQCPEGDCLKTFRKENHLQIHIKHYHKELAKGLGEIPNMQDLAALRTPVEIVDTPPKISRRKSVSASNSKSSLKEELKKEIKKEPDTEEQEIKKEPIRDTEGTGSDAKNTTEISSKPEEQSSSAQDGAKTVDVGPVSTADPEEPAPESNAAASTKQPAKSNVAKLKLFSKKKKGTKKTKSGFVSKRPAPTAAVSKKKKKKLSTVRAPMDTIEADETRHSFVTGLGNDSFYRHGYGYDPDASQTTNASICGQYGDDSINAAVSSPRFISENGEVIKIVSMRKEEIINCLCGYGEEDGLMVQCELCLCWQHGICNGFERDTQVPDKYVCYICRNPQGGRESRRYIHDQDWLYEGKLPVANYHVANSKNATRFDILKQSHTLGGNLLELKRFMHSLKVKINIAEKKDHPKMYLWSKKWEKSPPRGGNGDLAGIVPLNPSTTVNNAATAAAQGAGGNRSESLGQKPQPIPHIPVPEAPIDPAECQAILLEHIQKQQNAAMARLQAMEAQIIALEAYDDKSELLESPTAKNYPKTKQTIHMLLNDLVKMKKIAAIHRSAQQPPHY